MYRKQLPRDDELRDMAQSPPSGEAYFSDFDNKLEGVVTFRILAPV
jgi:hypothetical protein